ncbi:MAG: hypothetical protein D6722_10205 [Bacteroidetes bacterium]|nr:MAG: hypothetical protein D6722_10205 [Bacteroidota bacterium]
MQFPELSLFKFFFWRYTVFKDPDVAGRRFSPEPQDEMDEHCLALARQIAAKYALIPTTEVWSEETATGLIKQIRYYQDAGLFASRKDALRMAEMAENYFRHLQQEAELGYKFLPDSPPKHRVENFRLYYHDLVLLDNLFWLKFENKEQAFIIYSSIEYLTTDNPNFCGQIKDWLENVCRKSELISSVAERQRNRYFLRVFDLVNDLKDDLSR